MLDVRLLVLSNLILAVVNGVVIYRLGRLAKELRELR